MHIEILQVCAGAKRLEETEQKSRRQLSVVLRYHGMLVGLKLLQKRRSCHGDRFYVPVNCPLAVIIPNGTNQINTRPPLPISSRILPRRSLVPLAASKCFWGESMSGERERTVPFKKQPESGSVQREKKKKKIYILINKSTIRGRGRTFLSRKGPEWTRREKK